MHMPAQGRQPSQLEHSIVAHRPGRFAGWPANNGVWLWHGNEILVGFSDGAYVEQSGHNIEGKSDNTASIRSLLSRSRDGGKTWQVEEPVGFVSFDAVGQPLSQPLRFDHPDLAMRVAGIGYHGVRTPAGAFYVSTDRGKAWTGPHAFGGLTDVPDLKGMDITGRTSYLVTGKSSSLFFLSARPVKVERGAVGGDKPFCAETSDGGKSFRFISWIVPRTDPFRAVMPSVVRRKDGSLVAALRRRNLSDNSVPCWVDCYGSNDNARAWHFLGRVAETGKENGNPPALVAMRDGRLCCVYGDRTQALLLGRYSNDGGATWGDTFTLRSDFKADTFGDNDLGYPRLVQLRDSTLVAMYYWSTAQIPQQHIAATRWKP